MRTTSALAFYCRKQKENKAGYAPIEASLTINSKRTFISLPRKEKPETFKKLTQGKKDNELKSYLEEVRTTLNTYQTELLQRGMEITAENLKAAFQSGGIRNYKASDLFKDYLDLRRKDVDLSFRAWRKYELVSQQFQSILPGDIDCQNITKAHIMEYYTWLKGKYDTSTTAGYMTKLKTFITYALDNDRMKINPFQGVKIHRPQKEITYLTEYEVERIKNFPLDNQSLIQVRDCFLVMCGTGLSYADLKDLRKTDITDGYIHKKRKKTGSEYISVVLPWAMEIIDRYDVLPVISNQKINTYLHCIEQQMNLGKRLHCHLARHTYATMLLNRGIRLETVSKTLGHKSTKITTQFYARLQPDTIAREVASAFH